MKHGKITLGGYGRYGGMLNHTICWKKVPTILLRLKGEEKVIKL
ncbi:MAG: hypothetical protein ACFNQD_08315 [Prevotella intermedia]|nr:hypothetical protein [Prevotella intermedia]